MTSIIFTSNVDSNYRLPDFPHITYDKVAVELTGAHGGGTHGGGAGAKLTAFVPDLTGKDLVFLLGTAATGLNDGGNASYLYNETDKKYIMVAGGGGGWGGGDNLASVVLLQPLLSFGKTYSVTVNGGKEAVLTYTDLTGITILNPGTELTEIPTITITATDTGKTVLLENGINAVIRLKGNNARGGAAGKPGEGISGGGGGSLGIVASKSESGVGGMGGTKDNLLIGKSGSSITQGAESALLGGKVALTSRGVGHGGLGQVVNGLLTGGCGGGGWGGGGGGGNYCGGGGGGSLGPIGTVYTDATAETTSIRFTFLPGLVLEQRNTATGVLTVVQENYSDTIKYMTQFLGTVLTIVASRDGLKTTSTFTLTGYYAKVQIQDARLTTLTAGISRTNSSLALLRTDSLLPSGFLVLAPGDTQEIIKYKANDTDTNILSGISRGYNATTAQAHANTVAVLPITFLAKPMGVTDTVCTLETNVIAGSPGYIMIGSEKIKYTNVSGTDLSGLIRGTPAVAHATTEPVKPFTVLTADVVRGATSITVESVALLRGDTTGRIHIGSATHAYTGITANTLTGLTPTLSAYTAEESVPVYYSYQFTLTVPVATFDLKEKENSGSILIANETIRYAQNETGTTLNLLQNDPPPTTEYAVDEKVLYAGKIVRELTFGLEKATVGGPLEAGRTISVVNGEPITALGTRYYTLPSGVTKIKIIATGGAGGGGVLGGLAARIETIRPVDRELLVGVGAQGSNASSAGGSSAGGGASIVANKTDGIIHVLAAGGGGAYGTSKALTQDANAAYDELGTYVNEYIMFLNLNSVSYAGEISNGAGGGGGGGGQAGESEKPGGAGKSYPVKGIPAVEKGNGSVALSYIEPLVLVRRLGSVLEMRQPGTEKDFYYSLDLDLNTIIARSKEGLETQTVLPLSGITGVRIGRDTFSTSLEIISGQRISTRGLFKTFTLPLGIERVKVVLTGACGGSFSPDGDGGGEGAELSGYMALPPAFRVKTGLAGVGTAGGGGSIITDPNFNPILAAGGGGGSSPVRPLLIADTNNKRVLLLDDVLTGNRRAITQQLSLPISVAYDAAWNIYVLDQGYNRIAKYDGDTLAFQYYVNLDTLLKGPTGFVIDEAGVFYITDQQKLIIPGLVSLALDFTPTGLAFSPTDIYLSDGVKNQVLKIDKKTRTRTILGLSTLRLRGPTGLTYRDEFLYICDADRLIIWRNEKDFTVYEGGLKTPQSVYVSEAYIYIADTGNDRIVRLDRATRMDRVVLGSTGSGALQFKNPVYITGPMDYKSGIGYPGGQKKISSSNVNDTAEIATLGNTDWQTVTQQSDLVVAIGDVITVQVKVRPRIGEGSLFRTTLTFTDGNVIDGTSGSLATGIGGDGGTNVKDLQLNLTQAARDHGGLWITFLSTLKVLPATDVKIQPLRQDHTDSNIAYSFRRTPTSMIISGFTPEGLRTDTDVSRLLLRGITTFVIHLPNKTKYILLAR